MRDKNHMSALDDNVVRFIKNKFAEKEGKMPEPAVDKSVAEEVEESPLPEEEAQKPKRHERKVKPRTAPGKMCIRDRAGGA